MEDDLKDDDELTPEVIDDALEDEEGLDGDSIVPKKKKVLDDDVESADDLAEEEDGVEDESYDDTYDQ